MFPRDYSSITKTSTLLKYGKTSAYDSSLISTFSPMCPGTYADLRPRRALGTFVYKRSVFITLSILTRSKKVRAYFVNIVPCCAREIPILSEPMPLDLHLEAALND